MKSFVDFTGLVEYSLKLKDYINNALTARINPIETQVQDLTDGVNAILENVLNDY